MSSIAKAVAAFFTSLGTWGATAFADGHLSAVEWFGLCGVVVATLAVWGVTNTVSPTSSSTPLNAPAKTDSGQVGVGDVLLIVVVVLLVLLVVGYHR